MSCGYILCTVLLSVAVLLAVTVTGAILFMNHYHTPVTESPPVISTNPEEANALVTIEKADSSRINIFIDPNCPDAAGTFGRLEGLQTSLLRAVTDHDAEAKATKSQQKALLVTVADEVAKLLTHAMQLRADCDGLKKGHSAMGQELSALQGEQGRLIQVSWGWECRTVLLGDRSPLSPGPQEHSCLQPLPTLSREDLQQKQLRFEAGAWELQIRKHNFSSSSSAVCVSLPNCPGASEPSVQPPTMWLSRLQDQFGGSEQSRAQHTTIPRVLHAAVSPPLYTVPQISQLISCVEMLTWVCRGSAGHCGRTQGTAGCSAPCPSLLVLISLQPELLDSPLLRFAPHPAALPRPPHVTRPGQVTSGDSGELAALSGHGYSCRLHDPISCPEMLFIPRGGGTDAPKFGDFSAPVAIGDIWTLTPGQKALEMP